MQPALTVLLCVGAAVVYGVSHDMVTARVCVEYFTVGHDPAVFPTDDPNLLALGWGVISSWWVGLGFGLALAAAARVGRGTPRSARSLVGPVLFVAALAAGVAFVAGVVGFLVAQDKAVTLAPHLAERVPARKHAAYVACLFAHSASYWVAFLAGGVQVAAVWLSRRRPRPRVPRPG